MRVRVFFGRTRRRAGPRSLASRARAFLARTLAGEGGGAGEVLARARARRRGDPTDRSAAVSYLQLLLPLFDPTPPPPAPRSSPSARARGEAGEPDPTTHAAPEPALATLWEGSAADWSATWGVTDLRDSVRVELSHRMRSSLGGFYPRERLIRIADTLLEAPPRLLHEVLCHEAAHAAVHLLHGDRARSHGREWRELMRAVGLEPRVRIPREEIGPAAQRAARKRWVWRHRCPACRAQRFAGRPVRQWRCAPCRAAGRDGKLAITRVAARAIQ